MESKPNKKCENKDCNKKQDECKVKKWLSRFWGWIREIRFTDLLIIVCTSAIALIGYCQWVTLKDELRVFEGQLKETTAQFHSSHRPWCIISENIETPKPVSFESGKVTFAYNSLVKNSGTSPAFNVVTSQEIKIGAEADLLQYAQHNSPIDKAFCEQMTKIVGGFLIPGDARQDHATFSQSVDISQIKDTKIMVMLILNVAYRDEFQVPHCTGERWRYIGEGKDREYLPTKDIKGQWVFLGLGSVAY